MILPLWIAQPWFPMVFEMFDYIYKLPPQGELFRSTTVNSYFPTMNNPNWKFMVGILNIRRKSSLPFPVLYHRSQPLQNFFWVTDWRPTKMVRAQGPAAIGQPSVSIATCRICHDLHVEQLSEGLQQLATFFSITPNTHPFWGSYFTISYGQDLVQTLE